MAIKIVQNNRFSNNTSEDYKRIFSTFDNISVDGIYFITDIYDVLDRTFTKEEEIEDNFVYELTPMQLYKAIDSQQFTNSLLEEASYPMNFKDTPTYKRYKLRKEVFPVHDVTANKNRESYFATSYYKAYSGTYHNYIPEKFNSYLKNGVDYYDKNNYNRFVFKGTKILGLPQQITGTDSYSSSYRLANDLENEGLLDFVLRDSESNSVLGDLNNRVGLGESKIMEEIPSNVDDYKAMYSNIDNSQLNNFQDSHLFRWLLPHFKNRGKSLPLHFNRNSILHSMYFMNVVIGEIYGEDEYYGDMNYIFDNDRFPTYNVFPSKNYFPNIFGNDPLFDTKNQGRYLLNNYYYLSNPNINFDTKTDYVNDLYYLAKYENKAIFDISKRYRVSTESHDDLFARLGILIVQTTDSIVMQKFINREYIFYRYGYKYGKKIRWTTWKNNIPNNTKNSDNLNNADNLHYPIGFGAFSNNGHLTSIKGKTYNRKDIEDIINMYGEPLSGYRRLENLIEEYFKTRMKKDFYSDLYINIKNDEDINTFNNPSGNLLVYNETNTEDNESRIVIEKNETNFSGIQGTFERHITMRTGDKPVFKAFGINYKRKDLPVNIGKDIKDTVYYQMGHNYNETSGGFNPGLLYSEYTMKSEMYDVPTGDPFQGDLYFNNGYKDSKIRPDDFLKTFKEGFLTGKKSYVNSVYDISAMNYNNPEYTRKIRNYASLAKFGRQSKTWTELRPNYSIGYVLYISCIEIAGESYTYHEVNKEFHIRRYENFIYKGRIKKNEFGDYIICDPDDTSGFIFIVGYDCSNQRIFCYSLNEKGQRVFNKVTFNKIFAKKSSTISFPMNLNGAEPEWLNIETELDNHNPIINK